MNAATSSFQERASGREGPVARAIERRTSKIPSDLFLWAAGAAMIGSGIVQMVAIRGIRGSRMRRIPLFVIGRRMELVAPMLLMLGIYNKLVKLHGS